MPDSSSGLPNVKRFRPVTGSVPTVAIISPSTPAMSPLTSDSPDSDAMTLRPSTPSAKYDVGVNASATRDSGSVSSTSTTSPNKPADEARIQRDAQRLARLPLLLHRVTVDDRCRRRVGAGVRMRIAGIDPPYSAPT